MTAPACDSTSSSERMCCTDCEFCGVSSDAAAVVRWRAQPGGARGSRMHLEVDLVGQDHEWHARQLLVVQHRVCTPTAIDSERLERYQHTTRSAATHVGSAWPPRSAPRWPSPRRTRCRDSRCSTCSRSRAVVPMVHARSIPAEDAAPRARKRAHLAAEVPEDDSGPLNVHARDCKRHTERNASSSSVLCPPSFVLCPPSWSPDDVLLRPTVGGILSSGMPGLRPKMPFSCSSSVCRSPSARQSHRQETRRRNFAARVAERTHVPTVLPASSSPTMSRCSSALEKRNSQRPTKSENMAGGGRRAAGSGTGAEAATASTRWWASQSLRQFGPTREGW